MDHVQADGLLRWFGADLAETQVAILVVLYYLQFAGLKMYFCS